MIVPCAIGAAAIFVLRAVETDDAPPARPTDYARALAALCESSGLADEGDLRRANGVFLSRAHLSLHDLAAEVSSIDRSASATLLEAKAEVEATLPLDDPDAGRALDELVVATAAAIEIATDERPPTCEDSRR